MHTWIRFICRMIFKGAEAPEDKVDSAGTPPASESFYLRPQSPASPAERSFFASTPKADSAKTETRPPHSPLTNNKDAPDDDKLKKKVNGIDKTTAASRGQLNSDSSYSIDILSGGESECESLRKKRTGKDDTLGRLMKSTTASNGVINTGSQGTLDPKQGKRNQGDKAFYIAKELLMTEKTYKKDLEVITMWLREEVPLEREQQLCGGPLWEALEGLAGCQAGALRGLEARLAQPANNNHGSHHNAHHAALMLDFLHEALPWYNRWISEHLDSLQRLEAACTAVPALERVCRDLEQTHRACYLPLTTFALKPLYRLLHYRRLLQRALELHSSEEEEYEIIEECLTRLQPACATVEAVLPHTLNYCHLCLLHRDIDGFDNLVVPGRQFIRQGCLFKHSNKGPQQRMFFLFSDMVVYGSKGSSSQQHFRVHGAIPLYTVQVEPSDYSNAFTLYGGGRAMTLSASSAVEKDSWLYELENAAEMAKNNSQEATPVARTMSTSVSAEELNEGSESGGASLQRSNTLAHVCWHRNASLSWQHLSTAMENQLSGYLLRKFKNSLGWQKLWVVFASFCLYFYKTCQDDYPLASLPLLGYVVTTPSERDGINKDFVFKLIFKNHVYFFRAESDYTFSRWMEVIGSATAQQSTDI